MIKALAEVTGYHDGWLSLACQQQTSCGSCQSQSQCGTGIVSKALPGKVNHVSVRSPQPLPVGTLVEIGLGEATLLRSALVVYMVPLVMMLVGALLGQFLFASLAGSGEGGVIALSLGCGALGVVIAQRLAPHVGSADQQQPALLRVMGEPISGLAMINTTHQDSD
ncbi:SoxR reducing system RseC family protein [Salinivibrio sp. ES.052]|uniref:SoxR reducing system RseC family protein n=1 Tax=Salinivibrio sp. ES.052 TaxID=1882823 RepID=UPI000929FD42|nr:SoxR reducing system RseC family protein [Salinivibrio sp. ES.052]SIO03257.1 positive regulator of sigma(E), RseC/MucC [Salinivibrio sp. ES.052]